jgi:hypothetical protein
VLSNETRIGRDPHADVFLGHAFVGRWRCFLIWDEGTRRHIIDRGWIRPVFVNDKEISREERVALQTGDRIAIVDTTFVYEHLTPVD